MTNNIHRLSATEVVRAIRDDSVTVEDYAKSLLCHIGDRQPTVKAWESIDAAYVMSQARALEQVPKDKRGPLHGVGVAIKDIIYTKGMPTQHHSSIYANDQPEIDAASVMILRKAGALLLGKTMTGEFGWGCIGPGTTNPHDSTRTPGGTSSGSAAAVADFQASIAIGTQTGGSTIRPASFNGIYAIKPTWNAISTEGAKVYSPNFDTIGLFARTIDDLELLADVFKLKDDDPRPDLCSKGIRDLKFAVMNPMTWQEAEPGTVEAFMKGPKLLQAHGATVEHVDFPAVFNQIPAWQACVLMCDGRVSFLSEYQHAKDQLAPGIIDMVEGKDGYSRKDYLEAIDGLAALRSQWDAFAAGHDAVIVPSAPDEAPKGLDYTGSGVFNGIWSTLHVPVVNVPGFQGEHGMPIGLSLVAPRYHDRALSKVAGLVGQIWEKEGGWSSKL